MPAPSTSSPLFGVNILSSDQRELARVFGRSGAGKFDGVGWTAAANGAPVLDGVLTWAGCVLEDVHEAGDHYLAVARVTERYGVELRAHRLPRLRPPNLVQDHVTIRLKCARPWLGAIRHSAD